jgi:hypothetical protein
VGNLIAPGHSRASAVLAYSRKSVTSNATLPLSRIWKSAVPLPSTSPEISVLTPNAFA